MPKIIDLEVLDNFKTRQDEQNDGHFIRRSDVTKSGDDVKVNIDPTDPAMDLKLLTPESIFGDVANRIISLEHIPAAAREYVVTVNSEAAKLALTKNDIQNGDVVHVIDTTNNIDKMYYVVDDTKLGTENAFQVFKAGIASEVAWANVTGKPSSYTPSSHSHVGTEVKLTGYSKASSAAAVAATDTVNAAIGKVEKSLDGKAASSHSHVGTEVKLTGYSKASSAAAVAATDTVNAAIGKVEKSLDGKAASSHTHGGGDITSAVANATNATNATKIQVTDTNANIWYPLMFSSGSEANTNYLARVCNTNLRVLPGSNGNTTVIQIGNEKAVSNNGTYGIVRICSTTTGNTSILSQASEGITNNVYLPKTNGTLALTTDPPIIPIGQPDTLKNGSIWIEE